VLRSGRVWSGMVWYGTVGSGTVRYGKVLAQIWVISGLCLRYGWVRCG